MCILLTLQSHKRILSEVNQRKDFPTVGNIVHNPVYPSSNMLKKLEKREIFL